MRPLVSRLVAAILVSLAVLSIPRSSSADSVILLSGFPLLKQQHMLTCEAAAASMATKAVLTEAQIMARMPRSADPNRGFRGNLDGLPDPKLWNYGVYAGPVSKVLGGYGYCAEYRVEQFLRDAKLIEIGGGTLEAHQKNITRDLTRR